MTQSKLILAVLLTALFCLVVSSESGAGEQSGTDSVVGSGSWTVDIDAGVPGKGVVHGTPQGTLTVAAHKRGDRTWGVIRIRRPGPEGFTDSVAEVSNLIIHGKNAVAGGWVKHGTHEDWFLMIIVQDNGKSEKGQPVDKVVIARATSDWTAFFYQLFFDWGQINGSGPVHLGSYKVTDAE